MDISKEKKEMEISNYERKLQELKDNLKIKEEEVE